MRSARFALPLLFLLTAVPAVAADGVTVCGITVPKDYIDKALRRLSSCPGLHPTIQNLAFATTYNAAAARYRGIVLSTNVGLTRNVSFNAAYIGIPQELLWPSGATSGLTQSSEEYGLPFRQYWLTVKVGI